MKSDLIREFEMMEGISVDQFDLKEWHRFERFVLSREKENKEDMKKYTLIYADIMQLGSHQNSITKLKYVECLPTELDKVIEEDIGWGNIWFIFDGHCKQSE